MPARARPVAALLFGSGFCALVYQVGWLRELRLIFGASTAASAAILAIFIGGLGAGALLVGARADRHPRPLVLYSALELFVAVSAALTPLLLAAVRAIYIASGGSSRLGTAIATIERLVLSAIVLGVPTMAMGGTLPAAGRAVTRAGDAGRRGLAALYASNTLGAVAGCFAATFFLLEMYGTRATLWIAAAINLGIALVARALAGAQPQRPLRPLRDLPDPPGLPDPLDSTGLPAPRAFLVTASATVGAVFFLLELVWYRMLAPLLGGSVFTFGLVLSIALAGIGFGGLAYASGAGDRRPSLVGFASACLVEALAVAFTFALGDRVAILALALQPLRAYGFGAVVAAWSIVAAIVVLPPAVAAGYQFPLLVALFGEGRRGVARDVGLAYAANTAGAIVGSLAGGFGALPLLSAPGAWRLAAVVLVALGLAAAFVAVREERRGGAVAVHLALAAAAIVFVGTAGPTAVWRHGGIGAGRAPADALSSRNALRAWEHAERGSIVWEGDGVESSVALALEATGYAFIVNGKSDGALRADAGTQVMFGLVAAIGLPRPRRALVVGLGSGSTAGWLAAMPAIERVDVVELEPLMLDVARASDAVNHDAMRNPKIHVAIGDAREALLTSGDRYDVIASEPSNPFRAGIASLFTLEYYRAAARRLSGDGVFAQWVQGYEIDAATLRTIYATMAAVFPQVETWQAGASDLVLVGSMQRRVYGVSAMRARIAEEPFASALARAWRVVDLNGVLAHYLASDALARGFASASSVAINTDDRNLVEFAFARSVGGAGDALVGDIRTLAQSMRADRPPLDSDAGISWPEVDTHWSALMSWNVPETIARAMPMDEQLRQYAEREYAAERDSETVRALWRNVGNRRPRDPTELAMLADLESDEGKDEALAIVDELRRYEPAEADTMLAALRLQQRRVDDAAAALEAVFTRLRTDPWPLLRYKQKALDLANEATLVDPALARRLYEALIEPFSIRAADSDRLLMAADLTTRFDFRGACRKPIAALEPYVPWTKSLLTLRRDCYRETGDPLRVRAARELQEFLDAEPPRLVAR